MPPFFLAPKKGWEELRNFHFAQKQSLVSTNSLVSTRSRPLVEMRLPSLWAPAVFNLTVRPSPPIRSLSFWHHGPGPQVKSWLFGHSNHLKVSHPFFGNFHELSWTFHRNSSVTSKKWAQKTPKKKVLGHFEPLAWDSATRPVCWKQAAKFSACKASSRPCKVGSFFWGFKLLLQSVMFFICS